MIKYFILSIPQTPVTAIACYIYCLSIFVQWFCSVKYDKFSPRRYLQNASYGSQCLIVYLNVVSWNFTFWKKWIHLKQAFNCCLYNWRNHDDVMTLGPVTTGLPPQSTVKQSFDVFLDVHPHKRLNKQWICRWFKMTWRSYDVTAI